MKTFFAELFTYNRDMNQRVIALLSDNREQIGSKSVLLMSHIINAQRIWNFRISLEGEPFGVWQEHPIDNLQALDQENYERSLEVLSTEDLERMVSYKMSTGVPFVNSVRDILFHAINHGTYHRAQIATDVKVHGVCPLLTDFIFYKR
ncbi:DinB family protein [Pedobacter deserti]|uniref:DinB family protein n=1 Tax=Pedobacter deserti TaxID=2817382 RepID=UPI00210A8362|nr:DinB family protein [Pedobacter sp. SYSU D00382]